MPERIEDYALIGDCETAALVARNGSIDWLCWPRFDSPACFASLLGDRENGRWKLAPTDPHPRTARSYRDGTLILETRFETATGAATLIDFMPIRDGISDLVRIVVGERGAVEFRSDLVIRFDYGSAVPWVFRSDGAVMAIAGPELLCLRTPVPVRGKDMHTIGKFTVRAGERVPFVLTHSPSTQPAPRAIDPEAALRETEVYWRKFSDRCPPVGPWTEAVRRSLITLKALTYQPTGGIVAAATTSLPEWIGGPRNWDYRYCWLRDATFTLLALMNLGYYEEAECWRDWLMRAVAGSPAQMQIMYGIGGERRLVEWEVPWLDGYEGSRPVRVGNAAASQRQLDVYGEVSDALFQALKGGLRKHPRAAQIEQVLLQHLVKIWNEPDEGIWEVRGPSRHFTHSKVMAWTAFDRAAKSAGTLDSGPLGAPRWRAIADEIHAEVCANAFDPDLNSFTQSFGSKNLDASLLLIPLVGFLPPDDPRVVGTVAAIERHLMRDGFVLRYEADKTADGLVGEEGTFLACSFWLAQVYALQKRYGDGRVLFERLLGLVNDVGLLAEEYDPRAKRQLGNFPQAFSHVGLINVALALAGEEHAAKRANGMADAAVATG